MLDCMYDFNEDIYSTCSEIIKNYALHYQFVWHMPVPENKIDDYINQHIDDFFGVIEFSTKSFIFSRIKHEVEIAVEETKQEGSCLEDKNQNHIDWFDDALKNTDIAWDHWNFYKKRLKENNTPQSLLAAEKINKETNAIMRRLENPMREGAWDNRGLVVGDIQSGKTSNYVGLMAKAIDAGYKVIIVLAGNTNDLRKQTQERIDDGLLGYRTDKKGTNGINPKSKGKAILTKTSCDAKGDYKKNYVFTSISDNQCILYVVKKNASVLRNILEDFYKQIQIDHTKRIENTPLLLIDDEADHYSQNVKTPAIDPLTLEPINPEDVDPTTINRYIRAILSCFEKSAYVGYTATPYANIFGLPDHGKDTTVSDKKLERDIYVGEDLFPRNFIYKLASPFNYVGVEKVFGIQDDGKDGLPIIIETDKVFVNDFKKDQPTKRNTSKLSLVKKPESLKYAIYCFIIASIVKEIRKTKEIHNTMLVHVDRLTSKHKDIETCIAEYISAIKEIFTVEQKSVRDRFIQHLQNIWEEEFVSKHAEILTKAGLSIKGSVSWDSIANRIPIFIANLSYKVVNGTTPNELDYDNYKEGLNVIAIGGDKLARGLTLRGLTISYFLRNAGTYDSLTQMGRWFGYRDDYLDVCRIFTLSSTVNNFCEIATAVHDINLQFEELCKHQDKTPLDYGLRVLTNPRSKLLITAKNKSKAAIKHTISFSGSPVPTAYLPNNQVITDKNFSIMKSFVKALGTPSGTATSIRTEKLGDASYYWKNVPSEKVINNFLNSDFCIDTRNTWFTLKEIVNFVESTNKKYGEIKSWTVVLVNGGDKTIKPIAYTEEITILASERKLEPSSEEQDYYELNRRRIASGIDEAFDLTSEQYKKALEATNLERKKKRKKITDTPNSHFIRLNRDKSTALLLLYTIHPKNTNDEFLDVVLPGFMISFPELGHREMDQSYWANVVYARKKTAPDQTEEKEVFSND